MSEEIFSAVAAKISDLIREQLTRKEVTVIGLPGGRSIQTLLSVLIKSDLPWEKIHIFLVDEREVPVDHVDSNYRLIRDSLSPLSPGPVIHPYQQKDGVQKYSDEFSQFGSRCDLIILSSGEDGHVASLFPGHPSIMNEDALFIEVNNSPKPPPQRMSMSRTLIVRSQVGILLILGESKREAFKRLKNPNISWEECPAKLIYTVNQHHIFTDLE